jgi:hypothetical protein
MRVSSSSFSSASPASATIFKIHSTIIIFKSQVLSLIESSV